jgi:hypothetical protein
MAEETYTDTGFVPGKAYSQEEYLLGRPDFYKDYLSMTGIKSTVKDDDDDDDDKKQKTATVLSATGVSSDDSDEINLLSNQFKKLPDGTLQAVGNYYDAKVNAVDLQSMDLSAKSWDDYKKSKGIGDKSDFQRNATITSLGYAIAGPSGALIGSALFGEPVNTPWGTENPGGGMLNVIGNMAISEKMAASKEVQAAQAAFNISDLPLDHPQRKEVAGSPLQDTGYAINVDGTYLVRRPGDINYIGTLPTGTTNQKILNMEAIQKGFLPVKNGISDEEGFGVGGVGGYRADGWFVDANGQTSYYGSEKALIQLANKEFGGNRSLAEQWLAEVRKGRNMFSWGKVTKDEATKIKNKLLAPTLPRTTGREDDSGITTKPTPTGRFGSGEFAETDVISGTGKYANYPQLGPGEFSTDIVDSTKRFGSGEFDDRFIGFSPDEAKLPASILRTPDPMDIYNPRTGLYESEIDQKYVTKTPPITTPTTAKVTRTRLPDVLSGVSPSVGWIGKGEDLSAKITPTYTPTTFEPGQRYTTTGQGKGGAKVAEFAPLPDPFFQDSDDGDDGDSFDDYETTGISGSTEGWDEV